MNEHNIVHYSYLSWHLVKYADMPGHDYDKLNRLCQKIVDLSHKMDVGERHRALSTPYPCTGCDLCKELGIQ